MGSKKRGPVLSWRGECFLDASEGVDRGEFFPDTSDEIERGEILGAAPEELVLQQSNVNHQDVLTHEAHYLHVNCVQPET